MLTRTTVLRKVGARAPCDPALLVGCSGLIFNPVPFDRGVGERINEELEEKFIYVRSWHVVMMVATIVM